MECRSGGRDEGFSDALSLSLWAILFACYGSTCRYDVFRRGFSCTRVDWIMIFLPVNLIFGIFFFIYIYICRKNVRNGYSEFRWKVLNLNIAISEIRRMYGLLDV